jgi:hypothetical protein
MRVQADVAHFAAMENGARAPQLLHLLDQHVDAAVTTPTGAPHRASHGPV